MKYINTGFLVLLIANIISCSKLSNTPNSTEDTDSSKGIDTIRIESDYIDKIFNDGWDETTFYKLKNSDVSREIRLIDNRHTDTQDSLFVFTSDDFKYSFLKVTEYPKILLEYFEEYNLENRSPFVDRVKEMAQMLADEMGEAEKMDKYVIQINTEMEMSFLFLEIESKKVTSAKYSGYID